MVRSPCGDYIAWEMLWGWTSACPKSSLELESSRASTPPAPSLWLDSGLGSLQTPETQLAESAVPMLFPPEQKGTHWEKHPHTNTNLPHCQGHAQTTSKAPEAELMPLKVWGMLPTPA